MSTTKTKPPKRHNYPYFAVTGLVHVYEQGESHASLKVQAHANISWHDEAASALLQDGRWRLERLGVSKERLAELFITDYEITSLRALDAKHVHHSSCGEPIEAFFDGYCDKSDPIAQKKRDALIRQRRLLPVDRDDMVAMYGPKEVAAQGGAA